MNTDSGIQDIVLQPYYILQVAYLTFFSRPLCFPHPAIIPSLDINSPATYDETLRQGV